jgi:glycosyltransferase involved in cell wall biosynthesis
MGRNVGLEWKSVNPARCALAERRPTTDLGPMPDNVAVVVPCYKATATIGELIARVTPFVAPAHIYCVDDGSGDGTDRAIEDSGARLLRHQTNQGKGRALQTAFAEVVAKGYSGAVAMDADLQHLPEELPHFLNVASRFDVVIGTRDYDIHNMPLDRWLTNRVTSLVTSALAGTAVTDSQSGYRYLSRRALADVPLATYRYDMESEQIIRAGRMGLRIGEVPVSTVYGDGVSHIRPGADTLRFVRMVLRNLFWRPRE